MEVRGPAGELFLFIHNVSPGDTQVIGYDLSSKPCYNPNTCPNQLLNF